MRKKTSTASFGTTSREGHDASAFYERKLYQGKPKKAKKTKPKYVENIPEQVDVIHCHDSRKMEHLPDNSIHLMVTSPPYNVGKDYEEDLSLTEYKNLLGDVMQETYRVLVEGGRACINIANIGRKPYIPLHALVIELANECGFLMRGEVIWDKGASSGSSCAWGSWRSASNPCLRDVHEYILIFSKGSFNRRSKGQNTIGRDEFIDATKSVWTLPTASAKKEQHPAPFPVELPARLIQLYSYEGDIVLDPFMGGGSTAIASIESDRRYVGYEIDKKYVAIANKKINNLNQVLFSENPVVPATDEPVAMVAAMAKKQA